MVTALSNVMPLTKALGFAATRSFGIEILPLALTTLLIGSVPALAQDVTASVAKSPPKAPYQQVSKLVKLPDFLPGMGQLFVDPATLPAVPFSPMTMRASLSARFS